MPLSYVAPIVPIAVRILSAIVFWRAAKGWLDEDEKQVDEHRTLIVALAGFSLAGIAIIGTQSEPKYGPPLFDILVSFLLYLGSLGVQSWKDRRWHDLLGDALRDAGNSAMLLFSVRLAVLAAAGLAWPNSQVWVVATLAAAVWLLDSGRSMLLSARAMCAVEGRLREEDSKRAGAEPKGSASAQARDQEGAGQEEGGAA